MTRLCFLNTRLRDMDGYNVYFTDHALYFFTEVNNLVICVCIVYKTFKKLGQTG